MRNIIDNLADIFLFILGLSFIIFCCVVYYQSKLPDPVKNCTLRYDNYSHYYSLYGNRVYSSDVLYYQAKTFDEVVEKAKQINCPIVVPNK